MHFSIGRGGENHVTALCFRRILESIVGTESYIAPIDDQLSMELAANNTVNINSGVLFHHGGVFEVKNGTQDKVNYINGTQGMKRIDLIVARYTMDTEGIESGAWAVIQGPPDASAPVAPAYTEGNMQSGDLIDECPVAEIHFDGNNVTEIKMLLSVAPSIQDGLDEVKNDMLRVKSYSISTTIQSDKSVSLEANVELDGYTPLGIIECDHTSDAYVNVLKYSIANNRAYISLWNSYTAARSFSAKIKVLYVKNESAGSVLIG